MKEHFEKAGGGAQKDARPQSSESAHAAQT